MNYILHLGLILCSIWKCECFHWVANQISTSAAWFSGSKTLLSADILGKKAHLSPRQLLLAELGFLLACSVR